MQGAVHDSVAGAVQGAPDHVGHWAVSGCCPGCCSGAQDHVCHWAVPGCCPGCSGSCLPLGGVSVLSKVLSRVLRIMFAIGRCQGAVRVLFRVLRIMFAIGRCQGAVQGAVQGAPDHVCHWAVSGCCPGCSGSRLLLGGVRVLSIQRFNFYLGSMLV